MIWILFIALAAMFNSVMDSVENEHFFDTKFRNLNASFWYKRASWNLAKKIFRWKFDAWHTAKSLMILMIVGAVLTYHPRNWTMDIFFAGGAWNLSFNLFYNKIWKK